MPNKYCVDHLRPIQAASGLIFTRICWQSRFVKVILRGMADWKSNCEKPQTPPGRFIPNPKLKFMEQCREVMRFKRLALRSEQAYLEWIKRFLVFHRQKATPHPAQAQSQI